MAILPLFARRRKAQTAGMDPELMRKLAADIRKDALGRVDRKTRPTGETRVPRRNRAA